MSLSINIYLEHPKTIVLFSSTLWICLVQLNFTSKAELFWNKIFDKIASSTASCIDEREK
jgi:hypothetical protein